MMRSIEHDNMELKRHHLEWNILKDTLNTCVERGILHSKPNEQFVAFLVKLQLLNPGWGITTEVMKSRDNIQKLVKHLVNVLESQHLPSVIALKMQFYYTCTMEHLESCVDSNDERLAVLLGPLRKNILTIPAEEVYRDPRFFDRKIVSYAVLLTGMGNPQEPKVYCEAMRVWKSLMDEKEFADFLEKDSEERAVVLDEISYVICGIRLYNRHSGKAEGHGIRDFGSLITELIDTLRRNIEMIIKAMGQWVDVLVIALDRFYVLSTNGNDIKLALDLPADIKKKDVYALKDLLVIIRQHLMYHRNMLNLLKCKERQAEEIGKDVTEKLMHLDTIIVGRFAVVASNTFPLLIDLAYSWLDMKNRLVPLLKLEEVVTVLGTLRKKAFSSTKALEKIRDDLYSINISMISVANTAPKVEDESDDLCLRPQLKSMNLDVVIRSKYALGTDIVQYNGYCIFKLVETEGALLLGNQCLGLASYLGKLYAFSSPEACLAFSKNPSRYINRVINLLRKDTHLIEILSMRDYLEEIKDVEVTVEEKPIRSKYEPIGTQCEDEYDKVIEPILHLEYDWNVWSLRLKALQLGHLSNCVTKATQTIRTHAVTATRMQTFETKNKNVQTKKDNYVNTPNHSRFIAGLRGTNGKKWFDVDLTRPVEE